MVKLQFFRIKLIDLGYLIAAISAIFVSGSVLAHDGSVDLGRANSAGELASAFLSGIVHPLTGFDHLMMLIGVGLVAAYYQKSQHQKPQYNKAPQKWKKGFSLILSALFSMLLGLGVGAMTGFSTGIEQMILASVFVAAFTGAMAAYNQQQGYSSRLFTALPVVMAMMLIFHGWAHGLEASPVNLIAFAPGMLLSAGLLSGVGYQLGRFITPKWQGALLGTGGLLLALAG